MIFKKFWHALQAQVNKLANFFWTVDPVAQLQFEYDKAVDQLREGREGLEQYRGLVERVSRQVIQGEAEVAKFTGKVKAYLKAGNREMAGKYALELQRAKQQLAENKAQLEMHEKSYQNNVKKIQSATQKLGGLREKIQRYEAELKMSSAEAELAKLSETFNFDVTTDFGRIEQIIQERIDLNRGKARVAADLSHEGIVEIEAEEQMEKAMADNALTDFEIELGLKTPETASVPEAVKELGPKETVAEEETTEKA